MSLGHGVARRIACIYGRANKSQVAFKECLVLRNGHAKWFATCLGGMVQCHEARAESRKTLNVEEGSSIERKLYPVRWYQKTWYHIAVPRSKLSRISAVYLL